MLKIKKVDEAKIHSSQLEDWRQMKVVHSGTPCLLLTFAQANLQVYSLTLVLITPWYIIANHPNMVYPTLSWIIINPQLGTLVYHPLVYIWATCWFKGHCSLTLLSAPSMSIHPQHQHLTVRQMLKIAEPRNLQQDPLSGPLTKPEYLIALTSNLLNGVRGPYQKCQWTPR